MNQNADARALYMDANIPSPVEDAVSLEARLNPIDREALSEAFQTASPFPFCRIDDFLRPEFARAVSDSYPSYADARSLGREFSALNERLKVQITERERMPAPVRALADLLASRPFIELLEGITGIPRLLADPEMDGGGMHLVRGGGRLDVHVDFNTQSDRRWFRRLNILIFLNPRWEESWGGALELWDEQVRQRRHTSLPLENRCVLFATSERSFHGVTPVQSPAGITRNSFAAYYYTAQAPDRWDGCQHTTIFRPRPGEWWRNAIGRPAQRIRRAARRRRAQLRRLLGDAA